MLTCDQLLQRVCGNDYTGNPRLVHAFVPLEQRKLGDDARSPKQILTEYRVGYRMARPGVTVTLPATMDCSVQGAVCAHDGKKLSGGPPLKVSGPSGG